MRRQQAWRETRTKSPMRNKSRTTSEHEKHERSTSECLVCITVKVVCANQLYRRLVFPLCSNGFRHGSPRKRADATDSQGNYNRNSGRGHKQSFHVSAPPMTRMRTKMTTADRLVPLFPYHTTSLFPHAVSRDPPTTRWRRCSHDVPASAPRALIRS